METEYWSKIAKSIKLQVYDEMLVEELLVRLGMHHITNRRNDYITCGMPDGNNVFSTVIYNNENLYVQAYTRENAKIRDIINLVQYVKDTSFLGAINWICDELNIDKPKVGNYSRSGMRNQANMYINRLQNQTNHIKQQSVSYFYDESSLNSYLNENNTEFIKDNISYDSQAQFGLGIDLFSHRVTIPIRDEIGNLVGIKGRRVWDVVDEYNPKYVYLKQCSKSQNLFGLNNTFHYIKEKNEIIICEGEKGVMQLWSYGYKNAVAVGGHSISQIQVDKIIRLDVDKIIIAFDKDVKETTLYNEYKKLFDFADTKCIIDRNNLLKEKESPMDEPIKWEILYKDFQKIPRFFIESED